MRDGENRIAGHPSPHAAHDKSEEYDKRQDLKLEKVARARIKDAVEQKDYDMRTETKVEGFTSPPSNSPFDPPEWPYDGRCDGARPTMPLPGNPLIPDSPPIINTPPLVPDDPIIIPTMWIPPEDNVQPTVFDEKGYEIVDEVLQPIDEAFREEVKTPKLSGKETNPKDAVGIQKWRQYCTIPTTIIWELGVAMLEGARKYGRHNYRVAGVRASVYVDAAKGHIDQWWEGEDIDDESKLNHLTKAMASLAVLRDAMICDRWVDDRPPKVPMAKIKADLQAAVDSIFERIPVAKDAYLEGDQYDKDPTE